MRLTAPLLLSLALLLICTACAPAAQETPAGSAAQAGSASSEAPEEAPSTQSASGDLEEHQQLAEDLARQESQEAQEAAPAEEAEEDPLPQPDPYLICIDAGHQQHGSSKKEPVGPGSSTMKARVAGGTSGVSTGLPEYELTLQISLKLQAELESRGYEVVMVRTENDVDISNAERSEIANQAGADAFIRVHANGSESRSANGAMTICQTPENPYNGALYEQSRSLSDLVLDHLVAATGAKKEYVWETDTMTGINWCQVPVTIVEVGYMTNPEEDEKMATDSYQELIAQGIADGVDAFIAAQEEAGNLPPSTGEEETAPAAP